MSVGLVIIENHLSPPPAPLEGQGRGLGGIMGN